MSDPQNPTQVYTIGELGPQGPPPITQLSQPFTIPPVGQSGLATVANTAFMVSGQGLLLAGGGAFLVSGGLGPTTVTLTNLGGTNAAPGTIIALGAVLGLAGTVPALIFPAWTAATAFVIPAVPNATIPVHSGLGKFNVPTPAGSQIGNRLKFIDADSTGQWLTKNNVTISDPNGYPIMPPAGQGGPAQQGFTINTPGFEAEWELTFDPVALIPFWAVSG